MPYLAESDYRPPFYLFNGHLQTIVPAVMRRVAAAGYVRERIATPDDDFLDLDWALAGKMPDNGKPPTLVILSHGLEGDSGRGYMVGMVRMLNAHGYDALAWNYRSCSGEMNRQRRFYHIGATDDLHTVIGHVLASRPYTRIMLMGFSAGGNITLKYLGEQGGGVFPQIKKAVVFSVPIDVATSSVMISRPQNFIYEQRFLRSLRRKILLKSQLMPGQIDTAPLRKIRRLKEFDDIYTAPLHGFGNADEYYDRNSSRHFLPGIAIPTLIVNARNDPFLSPECLDKSLTEHLPNVWMRVPNAGGHCGFTHKSLHNEYWSERSTVDFLAGT